MGISTQTLKFVNYCFKKHGNFKKTLIVGRQKLFISSAEINDILNLKIKTNLKRDDYWDELLFQYFGATEVANLDISKYERADIIVDLNLKLKRKYKFDTIIQLGSIEHCINPLQAFLNLNEMGSQNCLFIHQLPVNNYIDHGFYQFSPDFFKVFYSNKSFKNQKIFLSSIDNASLFYEENFENKNLDGYKEFKSKHPTDLFFKCKRKNLFKFNIKNKNQPKYTNEYNKKKTSKPYISNNIFFKFKDILKNKLKNTKYFDLVQKFYISFFFKKKNFFKKINF